MAEKEVSRAEEAKNLAEDAVEATRQGDAAEGSSSRMRQRRWTRMRPPRFWRERAFPNPTSHRTC